MSDTQAEHNRKLNLMKAVKSIRVGDFGSGEIMTQLHELFNMLADYDVRLKQGEDTYGLTPDEVHSLSINNLIPTIVSVRERTKCSLAKAKGLVEAHPGYRKASVIRKLENDDNF